MAIHPNITSMLNESLVEMLLVAEHCVTFRKDPALWGSGGCFGYPAAILLFSIVDVIGSYHRGNINVEINVDGKMTSIKADGAEHFYILNSKYYEQELGGKFIRQLYTNYRSLLVHNASLPVNHFLGIGTHTDMPFTLVPFGGAQCPFINLAPFLQVSRNAVLKFLQDVNQIVPTSKQLKIIEQRGSGL